MDAPKDQDGYLEDVEEVKKQIYKLKLGLDYKEAMKAAKVIGDCP